MLGASAWFSLCHDAFCSVKLPNKLLHCPLRDADMLVGKQCPCSLSVTVLMAERAGHSYSNSFTR